MYKRQLYDRLEALGFGYGPTFRGLHAVWSDGNSLYAEATLPADTDSTAYGLHPALLDGVLHCSWLGLLSGAETGDCLLPFTWQNITLHATGARAVRIRITPAGSDAVTALVADDTGHPIASIGTISLRRFTATRLREAIAARSRHQATHDSLFRLDWQPATSGRPDPADTTAYLAPLAPPARDTADSPAAHHADLAALARTIDNGTPAPRTVLAAVPGDTVHETTRNALGLVQDWLANDRFADSRLVVVTRRAMTVNGETTEPDLAQAAVWGLIRSAQSEQPGRVVLTDWDGDDDSWAALPDALARVLPGGETQVALRHGAAFVPRLITAPPAASSPFAADPDATVLITGGTGVLGALLARHLVTAHGARRLLLVSRRGPDAEGADALRDELAAHGADITIAACDTADRDALAQLLAAIPAHHPLRAVIHLAGVTEDTTVTSMTTEQITNVLRPKADAAWHLHELTRHLDLNAFILFSSISGTLGGPGQANYAAANTYLDALARHRHTQGLPAVAMAWGLWAEDSGMTSKLAAADRARTRRLGLVAMRSDEALALFDAACGSPEAMLCTARLDLPGLAVRAARDGGGRDRRWLPGRRFRVGHVRAGAEEVGAQVAGRGVWRGV
ncbi:SDR family oxidoreductase, partial [Streptomyces specialis]|uniref:SDR family oxidoreductase n=1 Tax=Streptomyces specialis TaxID=498367 RepID=UPI00131B13FF